MSEKQSRSLSAEEALSRLAEGNKKYLNAKTPCGDISPQIREQTATNGQKPYAVIVTCSDSRVIPESIFSAGVGELFVIRVAGNVIDSHELGSIEYAVSHLGVKLVVVLGHTHCGAVEAALHQENGGYVKTLTDLIRSAVGDEKDMYRACVLNAKHSADVIAKCLPDAQVRAAIYDVAGGHVEFV